MRKRMIWIVGCNTALVALSAYGVYREGTYAASLGLVPLPLWQRLWQDLPDQILCIALIVGAVAELRRWRSAAIINSVAYVGVAAIVVWGTIILYGERSYIGGPVFVKALLVEAVPQFSLSILNLWLYRNDWRELRKLNQHVHE